MCCRKDDVLTARARARKRPIRAWVVRAVVQSAQGDQDYVLVGQQGVRAGATCRGPGTVLSDRGQPSAQPDVCCGGYTFVRSGMHAYVQRVDATPSPFYNMLRLPVTIDPADVLAVGPLCFEDTLGVLTDGVGRFYWTIVATKYTVSPAAWKKAMKQAAEGGAACVTT